MSDISADLRTRIAAVQAKHHHWDYAGALTCACGEDFSLSDAGWEAAVAEWAQHVADAVIRELDNMGIIHLSKVVGCQTGPVGHLNGEVDE